jgi:hypothetical protein
MKTTLPPELPPLPLFDSGGALVDIANREALYKTMEEHVIDPMGELPVS